MPYRQESFRVEGKDLVEKIKQLIQSGNIRRIVIKHKDGKPIIEIPLTIGVIGLILVPTLAAVGAVAALVSECIITVEREKD